MKKLTDEEIQKLLEAQNQDLPYEDSSDVKTYQLLFEALDEAPSEGLPMGFADQVVREAVRLNVKKQVKRYWVFISLSIFIALCISVVSLLFYQLPAAMMIFEWIAEARWTLFFGLSMFIIIQFADYWLMSKKHSVR